MYANTLDVGYAWGTGNTILDANSVTAKFHNDYHTYSVRDINSYFATNNLQLGIGIGYESYSAGSINFLPKTNYIPLFADIRAFNGSSKTSGYFICDVGYNIGLTKFSESLFDSTFSTPVFIEDHYKGGFFINPAIGLRWALDEKLFFCVALGYEYQNHAIIENLSGIVSGTQVYDSYPITISSNFFTVRASLGF